jgi:hypothetical protein
MMTDRLLYDGIAADAAGIHRDFPNAAMVAGYLPPSPFAWSQAEWGLFPHADHVTVATSAHVNAGDVLDCEAGNATPDQTAGWIAMRKQAGLFRPSIYCSLSAVPAVRIGTGKWVLGTDYDLWIAKWDGTTAIPYPHAVAKQEKSTAGYDVSVVYDAAWPHREPPAPPKPPAPKPSALKAELEKWLAQGAPLVAKVS